MYIVYTLDSMIGIALILILILVYLLTMHKFK